MVYSVKREELYAHRCKKYPRTCPSVGTKSNDFLFFTVVLLQPFVLFLFLFLLFLLLYFFHLFFSPSFLFFLRVIYYGFTPFLSSTCWSGVGSPFFLFPLPLLKPSILNCKAACSLFRHHLHINAARELAGQHLMRA